MSHQDVSFQPPQLFFHPPHRGGDREFKGHGPAINIVANATKVGDRQIVTQVYMDAMETKKDYTHFSGWSDRQVVFSVDDAYPGWRIVGIVSDQTSSLTVLDDNHAFSTHGPDTGRLVQRFTVHGDQKGDDQPWVRVDFNQLIVRITKD
jgi:hypothetical protein